MTFDELKAEADKDLAIDSASLDRESLRIPQLHNKYLNLYHDTKRELRKVNQAFECLKKIKWEYYTGKISPEDLARYKWEPFQLKILKNDLELYLKADIDLQKGRSLLESEEQKLEYLDSLLKNIMNRHWYIRSAIDWAKFTGGVS